MRHRPLCRRHGFNGAAPARGRKSGRTPGLCSRITSLQRGRPRAGAEIKLISLAMLPMINASTGPPPRGGGNVGIAALTACTSALLQRGRPRAGAEIARPGKPFAILRRASTGPPPRGGGNAATTTIKLKLIRGFNGAAPARGRKWPRWRTWQT